MEKFAEYGFNKSHTAAYAVVTYHTAWLKAHHSRGVHGGDAVVGHGRHRQGARSSYDDALANEVRCSGRTSIASDYRFEPVDRSTIRYGLGAVKGTGEQRGDT